MQQRWVVAIVLAFAVGLLSPLTWAQAGDKPFGVEEAQVLEAQRLAQETAQKAALAEWIVSREEAASGRAFDPAFRAAAKTALTALPLADLTARLQLSGLGPRNLGDSQADLVYTPVPPCRILDTRLAGGPLAAGTTRDLLVTGDTTLQGGANCAIPHGPATAAVLNFVAVGPAGPGDLRVTPFGSAMPNASILNYAAVSGLNIANGLVVTLCDPATTTCTSDITLQADVSATDVVADVQGYFRKLRTEQVKTTHTTTRTAATTVIGASCTTYTGGTISVTAPVAGKIAVRAGVEIMLNHVNPTTSWVDVGIGTTPTDCDDLNGDAERAFVSGSAATNSYSVWLHPSREFAVGSGPHTYYLTGKTLIGAGHFFNYGRIEATFIPD